MPAACKAEAHAGAHSNISATKHTHAHSFLPGALESWRILFIFPNLKNTPPVGVGKLKLPSSDQIPSGSR